MRASALENFYPGEILEKVLGLIDISLFPMPIKLRLEGDYSRAAYHIIIDGRDRDTGEEKKITTSQDLSMVIRSIRDGRELSGFVMRDIFKAVQHELMETFKYDGKRIADAHKND